MFRETQKNPENDHLNFVWNYFKEADYILNIWLSWSDSFKNNGGEIPASACASGIV